MSHVPNLDALPSDELKHFFTRKPGRLLDQARDLFPDLRVGYFIAYKQLLRYARSKHSAIELRSKGNIMMAQQMEEHMDRIYKQLPKWARW
jgi:hypothetical protein